jgi:UDP-N-acetylglucosamine pyrophosphorylase
MKIRQLDRESYGRFAVLTLDGGITSTITDDYTRCILTIEELKTLVDLASAFVQDVERLRDDEEDVDTDPPDEYNVFEDEDGHACNTTVDGG